MIRLQEIFWFLIFASLLKDAMSECNMNDDECEFWLDISHRLTMMYGKKAVYPYNGKLYVYDTPMDKINSTTPVSPDNVIVADGWETQKIVVAANNSMPGPPIEVYEGQTVIVHVTNHLTAADVTIHWHGLHQRDTPWMDGVGFITQCPIEPGQKFTYRFKAYPKGTFWYHSHMGAQLGMGLVGAFIIREKKPMPMPEHIMLLQDWNHDWDADVAHMRMEYGSYRDREKLATTDSLELGHFSNFLFQSGLINGRGRYMEKASTSNSTPLSVFQVEEGQSYRFRVIGGGNLYPFRVSVDGHMMSLIASDGFDLKPELIESFVINPGERYDFVIEANQTVGNYWIRAETLEVNVVNHIALAILRYDGANDEEPTSQRKQCTANDRCLVFNCPFKVYPAEHFTDCKTFDDFKAAEFHRTPGATQGMDEEIEEIFLNFAFPGNTSYPSTVNGVKFKKPSSPLLTQLSDIDTFCKPSHNCGDQKTCYCTKVLNLEHGKVYQMIWSNMGKGKGWAHPIHMHGHSFHVVKMGYPPYNQTTGTLLGDGFKLDTTDILCGGSSDPTQSFCNSPKWSNSSWGGNNIPGLELDRPPLKDTLIIPTGGYAIVRIRADNPGAWFMHCHIELHNLDGMAIALNEASSHQKPPPSGFPTCGNFLYDSQGPPEPHKGDDDDDDDDDCTDNVIFWPVVGGLIFICLIQLIVIVWMCQNRNVKGTSETSTQQPESSVYKKNETYDNPTFTHM